MYLSLCAEAGTRAPVGNSLTIASLRKIEVVGLFPSIRPRRYRISSAMSRNDAL
jgi:hypothetical protein